MSTKSLWKNGVLTFFDSITHERVKPLAPILFEDEFLGKALETTVYWTAIDVSVAGLTTPLLLADFGNGVVEFPLDVTSEAQESGFYWGDQRPFVLNRNLIFEARVRLGVLPTLLSEAVWGLAGDYNAVADTVAEGIWFKADGGGAVVCESDDTANNNDDVATGVTMVAGTFSVFRIDCSTITDVKFFIDGARVASATTFDMSTVPTLALQPYFHIAKASGAGLGTMAVDYVRIWQARS
jgi:hypothetical protein